MSEGKAVRLSPEMYEQVLVLRECMRQRLPERTRQDVFISQKDVVYEALKCYSKHLGVEFPTVYE